VTRCPQGVAEEDVAAWVIDAELIRGVDAASHVPSCPTCSEVAERARRAASATVTLRQAPAARAPTEVVDGAFSRIRSERAWLEVLGAVAGSFVRVARAVPDLAAGRRRTSRDDDTAELDTGELDAEPPVVS
jgi:hypothetical protein